jgi:hypothetical protein
LRNPWVPRIPVYIDIDLTTRQYIPEDSELHIRRRENLKSHNSLVACGVGEVIYTRIAEKKKTQTLHRAAATAR